jgi:class 3 adenylate cyclase
MAPSPKPSGIDGWVAKYMGDGVLAYFGYPLAHEDDDDKARTQRFDFRADA